jgi:hypothetical protein
VFALWIPVLNGVRTTLRFLLNLALTSQKQADDGGRTRDLKLGKLALYQLSYVRIRSDSMAATRLPVAAAI